MVVLERGAVSYERGTPVSHWLTPPGATDSAPRRPRTGGSTNLMSRRCSRNTYPESYITKCTFVYEDKPLADPPRAPPTACHAGGGSFRHGRSGELSGAPDRDRGCVRDGERERARERKREKDKARESQCPYAYDHVKLTSSARLQALPLRDSKAFGITRK